MQRPLSGVLCEALNDRNGCAKLPKLYNVGTSLWAEIVAYMPDGFLVNVSLVDYELRWADEELMTSSPLDFDCNFRSTTYCHADQLDLIVQQAMLEIYGRFEDTRSFTLPSPFAEIAVVASKTIGVAAFLGEVLTCLYVVERFRSSGVGTCLLHNAMLSGVRTALIPSGNDRVKTFFTHRGWYAGKENPADGGYGIFPKVVMHCGVQNQKIKLS